MRNFSELPMNDLVNDYVDTLHDIEVCKRALHVGVKVYKHGSVRERLEINKEIQTTIESEFIRRGFSFLIPVLKDC